MQHITAHVQQWKVHICSMTHDYSSAYGAHVKKLENQNAAKNLVNRTLATISPSAGL